MARRAVVVVVVLLVGCGRTKPLDNEGRSTAQRCQCRGNSCNLISEFFVGRLQICNNGVLRTARADEVGMVVCGDWTCNDSSLCRASAEPTCIAPTGPGGSPDPGQLAALQQTCDDQCKPLGRRQVITFANGTEIVVISECLGGAPIATPHLKCGPASSVDPPPIPGFSPPFTTEIDVVTSRSNVAIGPLDGKVEATPLVESGGLVLVPDHCPSGTCPVTAWVGLALGSFSFGGKQVTNAGITSVTPLTGTLDSAGTLTVPAAVFRVSGAVDHQGAALDFQSAFPLNAAINAAAGTVDFELTLADEDNVLRARVHGAFARTPPVARITGATTYECVSPTGTPISLSASSSTDREGLGDLARFFWYRSDVAEFDSVGTGIEFTDTFPLGSREVTVRAIDSTEKENAASTIVTVVDTAAPTLSAEVDPPCLWPPNHDVVLFELGRDIRVAASDACYGQDADVRIVDVTSSEDALANGSGHTESDLAFGSHAVCVRAERSGGGSGRAYRVKLEATDPSGNVSQTVVELEVRHDSRPGRRCTESVDPSRLVELTDPRCTAEVPRPQAQAPRAAAPPHPASGCSTSSLALLPVCALLLVSRRRTRARGAAALVAAAVVVVGCAPPASVSRSCVEGA